MWDNKVIPLTDATTKLMYARYTTVFGMDPPEDIEPTTDQIAAIKMLDDLNFIPGVDYFVFVPHGRQAMKKLIYVAQLWDHESHTYKRRDLPGPPDFDTWFRSWKVFKCTCLLLDICKVEPFDAYSDHIRSLHQKHGQKHWFIILQADSRLREESFERWLRKEEANGDRSEMNPSRKWDFLFRAGSDPEYTTAKHFWDKEVKDHVLYRKSFTQITPDGTVLDNLPHKTNNNYNNNTTNRQLISHHGGLPPNNRKRQAPHQDPSYSSSSRQPRQVQRGIDICRDFNEGKDGHTDRFFCPNGRSYICAICGQQHPQRHFRGKDKGNSKGNHKDKGKDKGKGAGQKGKKGKR
jgi:hypothetical protein